MTGVEPIAERARRALSLGRALRLVWQASPAALLLSAGLWMALGILPALTLLILKRLVDAVAAPAGRETALLAVMGLGLVTLVAAVCQSLGGLVAVTQTQRVADHVAEVLHAKSLQLDLEYYDDPRYYDVLHRAQKEAPYRPYSIVHGLTRVGQSGLALASIAGLLLSLEWGFALVLLASALPGLLGKLRASNARFLLQRARTEDERRSFYYQSLLIDGAYAQEVRLFGFGDTVRGWFRDLRKRLRLEHEALQRKRATLDLVTQALGVVPVFGALAYLTLETLAGRRTLGDLVLYYTAVQRGLSFFQELLAGLAGLYEDNLFLSSFFEFLELPSKVLNPSRPLPLPQPIVEGFSVEDLRFRYPRTERDVLQGVSMTLRPGEVVALVGENGAGKTTLVKLLCRLYDPTGGRILLDGIPIDQLATERLRGLITVAFQDYSRYNLTVRENITLGDVRAPVDEVRLAGAARLAGAGPVIERLPRGYETLLGHWLEGGHELSTGEWHRVALARTLWREAWLVVLDEPTSSMDPETERRFWDELRPALRGRSALLISHRFSTVRQADRIYVLAGGRIVEQGTHEGLMERGGDYARLYAAQARFYA